MASYTTNLNLKKPAGSETVSIGDINNNMDTIDQAYGTVSAQLGKPIRQIGYVNNASVTFSIPSNSRYLFFITAADPNYVYFAFVSAANAGTVGLAEIKKGANISSVDTSTNNKITVTFSASANRHYYCVPLNDAGDMTLDT